MSERPVSDTSQSSASQVDVYCTRFEAAWRSGSHSRLEDYANESGTSLDDSLLSGLISIELKLRREAGEHPSREEYLKRFPKFSSVIERLWSGESTPVPSTEIVTSLPGVPEGVHTATRYTSLREFRRGGLGILCRAHDEELHREVVVKFTNEACQADPQRLVQFQIEAEITGRLDHPGVVPVHGVGHDWDKRPFYVMRFVHGRELRQAIVEYHEAGGPAHRDRANRDRLFALLEHLVSACNTVAYAHTVGIVHCDLKPSNIMIGKYGETFVLDWGLATTVDRSATFFEPGEAQMRPASASGSQSGARGGTYGYISPEQLTPSEPVTPRSDIYSLGASLYELLTGTTAFNSRDPEIGTLVAYGKFKRPRELNPHISRRLEAICLKAMALSPNARYRTAKHLAADIQSWLRDEEVSAAPDGFSGRLFRIARRHRGATLTAVAGMLMLAITGTWAYLGRHHAEQEAELRKEIEANFTTSLDTLEDLSLPMANGELNNLELVQPYADTIHRFTKGYLSRGPGHGSTQRLTGRVYALSAAAERLTTGSEADALRNFARAEEIYKELVTETPQEFDTAVRLARIELGQGRLYLQRDDVAKAEPVLTQAKELLERLDREHPHDEGVTRYRAEAYHSLGEVYLARQRGVEGLTEAERKQDLKRSLENFELAKILRQQLVDDQRAKRLQRLPVDETLEGLYKRDLARSLGYLGDLFLAQGDIPEAGRDYEESLRVRQELFDFSPRNPEHRFQYARGLGNFGFLQRDYQGNLEDARLKEEKALEIQRKLGEEFPNVSMIQNDLGSTLNMLAEIYLLSATADPKLADSYRQQARPLLEAAADSGRQQAATTIYQQLADAHPDGSDPDRNAMHGLATSWALLALLEQGQGKMADNGKAAAAVDALLEIAPEDKLSYDELFTLAMARALDDDPEAALEALETSVKRGLNTVARIEGHREGAFRSIVARPELAQRFDQLVKAARSGLRLKNASDTKS